MGHVPVLIVLIIKKTELGICVPLVFSIPLLQENTSRAFLPSTMAYSAPISPSLSFFKNPQLTRLSFPFSPLYSRPRVQNPSLLTKNKTWSSSVVVAATAAEKQKKRYPGESKGFVEEMRFVAMRLHTKEQAKEGEKETKSPEERPVAKWEPTVEGYLRFLVDSKLVYDTLEGIIHQSTFPTCEFFFFLSFSV